MSLSVSSSPAVPLRCRPFRLRPCYSAATRVVVRFVSARHRSAAGHHLSSVAEMPASSEMRYSPDREPRTDGHKQGRSLEDGLLFREKEEDLALQRPFLICLIRSLYWIDGLRWSYISPGLFMENAATHFKSSDVHENYHYLKYRQQVSFLNCIIHPFPNGSICACSRNHLQTAHLFHSNHVSQSYLYHLTVTPFLELTTSLNFLFIMLGSTNLNLWLGATDSTTDW
ncbi:hypothetical protein PIB30_015178 [Stylosanthes scabra]|uniref:Uncharacterized protein n=1 Tax=Stylosanthes scabra TaxID=79078 RepID=A0ABU6U5R6_9FABA|nr:hypothetical protein [Stylosanthes scabra]